MTHPIEAAGAEGQLARFGLCICDEVGQGLIRRIRGNDEQSWTHRKGADTRKIMPGKRGLSAIGNFPFDGIGYIDGPHRQAYIRRERPGPLPDPLPSR